MAADLCKPSVGEVRSQLLIEKDVFGLEVAVPHVALVQVEQRLGCLAHDLQLQAQERRVRADAQVNACQAEQQSGSGRAT